MQQLLSDRAGVTDSTFLQELFLQCLPPNMRMVLTSTSTTTSLKELAELADKIPEVAAPTIVKLPRNADSHAPILNHQTTWPAVNGNRCVQPPNVSPIAHYWPHRLTFLVDTGAQVSVVPPTRTDRLRKQEGFVLSALNGTAIATYSTRSLTLNLGFRRTFRWIFIIANVQKPLLGADFLHHFGLLVDIANSKLVDKRTNLSIHGMLVQDTPLSLTIPTHMASHNYSTLLSEFPDFTKVHNYGDSTVKHDVTPYDHLRTSSFLSNPPTIPRKIPHCLQRIQAHARVRYCPSFFE